MTTTTDDTQFIEELYVEYGLLGLANLNERDSKRSIQEFLLEFDYKITPPRNEAHRTIVDLLRAYTKSKLNDITIPTSTEIESLLQPLRNDIVTNFPSKISNDLLETYKHYTGKRAIEYFKSLLNGIREDNLETKNFVMLPSTIREKLDVVYKKELEIVGNDIEQLQAKWNIYRINMLDMTKVIRGKLHLDTVHLFNILKAEYSLHLIFSYLDQLIFKKMDYNGKIYQSYIPIDKCAEILSYIKYELKVSSVGYLWITLSHDKINDESQWNQWYDVNIHSVKLKKWIEDMTATYDWYV